jgi:TatD DNase family protein
VITDTHCHVYWKSFDGDRAAVLERARAAGVERMIVVGTDLETSLQAFELARAEADMHPTAGIHPHEAATADERMLAAIAELCARPACVAVGETGLDYFKEYSPRERQLESFRWHLELARDLDKPVVVHCRDAHEAVSRLLREVPGVRGVMHCYTMGPDELAPYLEAGFHISFSGIVTYPGNEANRAAARAVPIDRLLVETDCPFLPPQGHRGRRNEPAYLPAVVELLARERGVDPEEVARRTSQNAAELFALSPPRSETC